MDVPRLRFDGFSENWIKNTIQYFIDNKSIIGHLDGNHGALYPKSNEFSKAGIPYITANDFITGRIDFNKCKYLPEAKAKLFKKGIAKNGDVLFAHNATVGPCAILRTSFSYVILSTTATYYRCDLNKINNIFLLYFFQSDFFVSQYSSIMSQSTRNQVPITTQRKLSLALPILPEQTKIANFLTAIDEKITQLTQKCDLLAQYKKGVMQQIFSQKLRFKDDDGREFPDWESGLLGDFSEFIQSGKSNKRNENGDFVLYGSTGEIGFCSQFDYQGKNILIARVGANAGYLYEVDGNYCVSDNTLIIHLNKPNNYSFFYNLLKFLNLNKLVFGSGQPLITGGQLKNLNILVPSIHEQTKIANFLTVIDNKIAQAQAQLDAVKRYKKGLLQQMFV